VLALGACACACAIAGCGGSGSAKPAATKPAASPFDFRSLQSFTCEDWQRASPQTRAAVIESLHSVIGGQVTGKNSNGRGSVLSDKDAYALFRSWCGRSYARFFVLYKLYGQAAGFAGVAP
jgi:hypothetical protein